MAWKLTVRHGPRVERRRLDTLDEALTALEERVEELRRVTRRQPVQVFKRRFEPVAQVAARAEVAGPGARGGIDLRGDGSTEAYVGRWRRSVVDMKRGETVYQALRRALRAALEG
jgi:hypothetical protein